MLMGLFSDDDMKKVAENDVWILWTDSMTRSYQKELDSYGQDGFTLAGLYTVVLAENKEDGTRVYLALDRKTGEPYADWSDSYRFDMLKMCMLEDERNAADIVRMAKRKAGVKDEDE